HGPPEVVGSLGTGSFNARHLDLGVRGGHDGFGYNPDLSDFHTDGFRAHSHAQRLNGNAKLDFTLGTGGKLTVLLNTVSLPEAQDPQGLTWQQFEADPAQAAPSALTYNTRKSVHQSQAGAVYTQTIDEHQSLRFMVYNGQRTVQQFLSIPVTAQASPLSSGGVVDLATIYGGGDLRWTWQGALGGRPLDFTTGLAYDWENQHRLGYNDFVGNTLGVVGALRRNEQDDVYNFDQYAQASWQFAVPWSLMLGVRHSVVNFASNDQYLTAANPGDSGRVSYGATNPVAGLMYDVSAQWHLYAAYGAGFETPSFSELGYRPDAASGLNFGLQPAHSHNAELGSKWRLADGARLDFAVFNADTRDEIAVLSSAGGRTIYQNVGRSERRGAELGLHLPFANAWQFDVAYTYLQARFLDSFSTCTSALACTVPADTRMPGVPRDLLHAQLRWGGNLGWHAGLSIDAAGAVSANDAGTLIAPGYAIAGVNAGYVTETPRYAIAPFLRVDNLFNQRYIGSVIVNQASGGSFEPAPGRNFWLGLNVRFRDSD
ncbi:MAG: TonB-dependent receptor family protein, partial [Gammaproteobacteria bacterium]